MLFRLMPVSYCDTIALFYILSACRRPLRSFPFAVAEISGRRLAVGPGGRHRALAVVHQSAIDGRAKEFVEQRVLYRRVGILNLYFPPTHIFYDY